MSPAIGGDIGLAVKVPVGYKHVIGRTWACPRARQDKTGQDRTGQDRHADIKTHRHTLPTDTPTHRHTRTHTHTHRHARTHSQTLFATACTPAILTLGETKADGCTP